MVECGPGPVVIFTIGTQGDVRPCVALGQGLHRAGYPVRIATSENFAELVRRAGLEFYPLTADFQVMLEADRTIADQGLNLRAMARIFRQRYAEWAPHWVEEGLVASEDAGLLIGVSNSTLLAQALAEVRRVPFTIARLQPLTPSKLQPPLILSGTRRRLPPALSLGAHHLLFLLVWRVMRPAINGVVRPRLGLPPHPWHGPYLGRDTLHQAKVINGFSRHVVPRPADWPESSQITGYWFFDQPEWSPPEALSRFLAAGPKPIYVGFGSMVSNDATAFTQTVIDAIDESGLRAVLATGWGGLDGEDGARDERIYFLRHAPHEWLFPRMAAAVHHGGAGTTAAAARAGIPSVVVPFYGDQPFWARRLHAQGVAPPAVDREGLSAGTLAAALVATQQPTMRQAAQALGEAVRAEDGVGEALRHLHRWGLLPGATRRHVAAELVSAEDPRRLPGSTVEGRRGDPGRPGGADVNAALFDLGRQTAPARGRPLALFERAMYVEGRQPVNITVTAAIHGRVAEERLRQALARVQAKHPLLRCLIVRHDGRPWFEPQEPAPPIPLHIVERRRDDDWIEASRSASRRRFDGGRQPLIRLIWLRGETRSELLLVCHHAICDGRSLLTLLHEILLLCDRPGHDIGDDDSLHTIEELLPAEVRTDRRLRRRVRYRVAALKLALRATRPVRSRRSWTYGEAYQSFWTLDEPDSRRLVEHCKAEGVSVFAAIGVAFMLAFRAVCGPRRIRQFVAPVDVRGFLPHLRADSLFAIAPTISLSPSLTPAERGDGAAGAAASFWASARALRRDMDAEIERLVPKVHARFLGMELLHDVYDEMAAYGRSRRAGRRVSLSYLGRLDFARDYRDFRLEAVRGISAMLAPTPAHLVVISSFAGRFDLSLASDETSLPYAQALAIQERATETLRTCAAPDREPPTMRAETE